MVVLGFIDFVIGKFSFEIPFQKTIFDRIRWIFDRTVMELPSNSERIHFLNFLVEKIYGIILFFYPMDHSIRKFFSFGSPSVFCQNDNPTEYVSPLEQFQWKVSVHRNALLMGFILTDVVHQKFSRKVLFPTEIGMRTSLVMFLNSP